MKVKICLIKQNVSVFSSSCTSEAYIGVGHTEGEGEWFAKVCSFEGRSNTIVNKVYILMFFAVGTIPTKDIIKLNQTFKNVSSIIKFGIIFSSNVCFLVQVID